MGVSISKFGDWSRAGIVLQTLANEIRPAFKAQLDEDGNLIEKTLKEHINAQDLSWSPLSEKTIELKHGNSKVYIDSGYLRDNLEVRKIRAPSNGYTLFIGASAWKKTDSGVKFSDLMIWLEYGTANIPPRPLIRPTFEEIKPLLENNWKKVLEGLVR